MLASSLGRQDVVAVHAGEACLVSLASSLEFKAFPRGRDEKGPIFAHAPDAQSVAIGRDLTSESGLLKLHAESSFFEVVVRSWAHAGEDMLQIFSEGSQIVARERDGDKAPWQGTFAPLAS
jgi:hypothetical protein